MQMRQSVSAPIGALIVVGIRWTDRLVGLVSTLILARLLAPEDFGIISMASLVIGLIDILLDMGVNITLVQNKYATQDDFDAAWTLRMIQSGLATAAIFLAAYPAASYFHDARVTAVVQALSLAVLLAGFENIGVVAFQKKMEFGMEFLFFFAKRISSFCITIAAAWYLHSYWSLVIGTVAARLIGVVLSFAMHPMRPRFSWVRMKAMLSFSSWNLLRGIGGHLSENLHRLLVGRRESPALMGSYTLASDIAAMPSIELLAPLNRVLFPMFVAVKDDADELKRIFLLAVAVQALVGVPAGAGLTLVAHELVSALMGERWMNAVPFIQIMGGINIVAALSASGAYVLLALGRARLIAIQSWSQVLMFGSMAVLLIPTGGATAIAELRLGVAATGLLTFIYLIRKERPSWHLMDMLAGVWRPCVASMVMAIALLSLPAPDLPVMLQLFLKTAVGALVYATVVLTLWLMGGQPDGAEAYFLNKVRELKKSSAILIWKR